MSFSVVSIKQCICVIHTCMCDNACTGSDTFLTDIEMSYLLY